MAVGDVLGHIEKENNSHWYTLSDGTIVSFHVAFEDKEQTISRMFVSDDETWPSITAARLGIPYVFMRNAYQEEIDEFLLESGVKVKEDENVVS